MSLMLEARERIRRVGRKPAHKDFDDRKFYVEMIFDGLKVEEGARAQSPCVRALPAAPATHV